VPQRAGEQLRGARRARPDELPKPPFAQWTPDWLWAAQRKLLAPFFVWVTVGLYDPPSGS